MIDYDWLGPRLKSLTPAQREWFFQRSRLSHTREEDPEERLRALWDQGPHYTGRKVWAAEHGDRMHFFFGALSEMEHLLTSAVHFGQGSIVGPP